MPIFSILQVEMDSSASLVNFVVDNIEGRIAMLPNEARFLVETVQDANAELYVEVGTLWGGTAILAALALPTVRVLTVDKMSGGFWETQDKVIGKKPTPRKVLENFAKFRVADRVSVHLGASWPWSYPRLRPDVFLVDGDHSQDGCTRDLLIAAKLETPTILVHDHDARHDGVKSAVDEFLLTEGCPYVVDRLEHTLLRLRKDELHGA